MRQWFSGRMLACHVGDPGSIPGWRIFCCFLTTVLVYMYTISYINYILTWAHERLNPKIIVFEDSTVSLDIIADNSDSAPVQGFCLSMHSIGMDCFERLVEWGNRHKHPNPWLLTVQEDFLNFFIQTKPKTGVNSWNKLVFHRSDQKSRNFPKYASIMPS